MDIKEIETRLKSGGKTTYVETAYLIRHNPEALAAFMIANNPGNVNFTLRDLGYDNLGFEPKKESLIRQLQIFITQKNNEDFNEVVKNFKINTNGLLPEFITELKTLFV